MNIEIRIAEKVVDAINALYEKDIKAADIQTQRTRKDFKGDFTVVVFPLLRLSKRPPEQTGEEIGDYLKENVEEISDFNVIKGFLNLTLHNSFWMSYLNSISEQETIYNFYFNRTNETVLIEYSSPNTNKPLHLGHIRNNLLGFSLSRILEAVGKKAVKVNLVNDRGIHICKSMLAWQKWGNGETPEDRGVKGDHLVGDYYVKFDQEHKKEIEELVAKGKSKEKASKEAPLMKEAQEMLNKWEQGDEETVRLWRMMNSWVLEGFDATYQSMGVDFDRTYYESEVYKKGKEKILEGLEQGIFFKKEDNSVWADFTDEELDQKLLLRSDGTSVYITQDIGTAIQRYEDYQFDKHVYVVGNEQNYHFQILKLLLKQLGKEWAENLYHLSYGMVELPEGKMKSREGTVVDADDLIDEMIHTARELSKDVGKIADFPEDEKEKIYRTIGLGGLKYFILKVDPKKNMTFDPKESIDLNGNTGPFIQYSYARINSLLEKAETNGIAIPNKISENTTANDKEIQLIKEIHKFPAIIKEAADEMNPGVIANYVFDLAKEYNQFYHDNPVIKAETSALIDLRIMLSVQTSKVIREAMWLLGIDMPKRM
jgi:arginyl-tRNA synthetase